MKAHKKTTKRQPGQTSASRRKYAETESTSVSREPFSPRVDRARKPSTHRKDRAPPPTDHAKLDDATLEDADRFLKRHRSMFERLAKL